MAAAYVGQVVFAFSRLDFTMALAIRNIASFTCPKSLDAKIQRLGFKGRLEELKDQVATTKLLTQTARVEFADWHPTADRLRMTRNAFVHGRWGMQTRDTLFNASTQPGETFSAEAKYYSLEELCGEADFAKQVLGQFHEWHFRNVVSAA